MMTSEVSVWRDISLKLDLQKAAPLYLDLLQSWSRYPSLVSEHALPRIIHRYENLWLPLLVEWTGTDLEPPLDVHWVWHVHMLSPQHYMEYCRDRFRRVLSHKIRVSETEERFARERTKLIWKDKYPAELYDLNLHSINPGTYQLSASRLSHLVKTASRVLQFTHQVSLPHYRDANFLSSAIDRYKRFLTLKKCRPHVRFAPPIDILLMWRLHALHPSQYYQEAHRPFMLQSVFSDVDLDGRCLLNYGYNASDWNTLYNDPLLVPGSAYRGSSGYEFLRTPPTDSNLSQVVDRCNISIDELTISDLWSKHKKLIIVIRLLGNSSFNGKEVYRCETHANKTIRTVPNPSQTRTSGANQGLLTFTFDSKDNKGLDIDIYGVQGPCPCIASEIHLNTMFFNPRLPFSDSSFSTKDFMYHVPKVSHVDPKVSFRCRVQAFTPEPHVLSLERTPFRPAPLSRDLLPFVRDLPKWREGIVKASQGDEGLSFISARHCLKDRESSLAFSVDVIKQHELDLGAVLVYHNNDHLVVAGHTVGDDTLASAAQLTSSCPVHLNPEADEQAMLLSNHMGQWAICKASCVSEHGEGRVRMNIFFLQSHTSLQFDIQEDEMQTIKFGEVSIDMPTGRISVDSRSSCIAENIALAFSVGVLYVSCQMRATILATSRRNSLANISVHEGLNGSVRSGKSGSDLDQASISSSKTNTSRFTARRRNRKLTRKRKMSASFTFLLATGLQIDVTLYGSTGNPRSMSRASLASIHLLYQRQASDSPRYDNTNNNLEKDKAHHTQLGNGLINAYQNNTGHYVNNMEVTDKLLGRRDDSLRTNTYMDIRL